MKIAIDYANLIGKYIRMERPATPDERALGDPATIGMECTVWYVYDQAKPGSVGIVSDEGLEMVVHEGQHWMFQVYPSAEEVRNPAWLNHK